MTDQLTGSTSNFSHTPITGMDALMDYAASSHDALQRVRVRQMALSERVSALYGVETYRPVGAALAISFSEAITDLNEFLSTTSDSEAEQLREGVIVFTPNYYENFYREAARLPEILGFLPTFIAEDDDTHSTNFITAKVLHEAGKDSGVSAVRFRDLKELQGSTEVEGYVYLDDWCVSGRQLDNALEQHIMPGIGPAATLHVVLMAANPEVVSRFTSRYGDRIQFHLFSDTKPTTDCAGFGYNGSVSWGYENVIGRIAARHGIAPPLAHHIMRPYKLKDVGSLPDQTIQERRHAMVNWIRGKIIRHTVGKNNVEKDINSDIYFFSGEWGGLSNFSAYRVKIWGHEFPTTEHAYQWKKFCETAPEIAEEILNSPNPGATKKIAERHVLQQDPDWSDKKLAVMRELIAYKVTNFPDIQRKLLRSKGRTLIEDNPTDEFWGRGMTGEGMNWLGKIWMEMRDKLITGEIKRIDDREY